MQALFNDGVFGQNLLLLLLNLMLSDITNSHGLEHFYENFFYTKNIIQNQPFCSRTITLYHLGRYGNSAGLNGMNTSFLSTIAGLDAGNYVEV